MWTTLPTEIRDNILSFAGPVQLATDKACVAATRIQRHWRRRRMSPGEWVFYRRMNRWGIARIVIDGDGEKMLRAQDKLICFSRLYVIPVAM